MNLVADIGGTNARFALVDDNQALTKIQTLKCADYPNLIDAVKHYLEQSGSPKIVSAALALAMPVIGDHLKMTNNHWKFSLAETQKKLGLQHLKAFNDFAALAYAIPQLQDDELHQVGGGVCLPDCAKALIGPGTGLGVSGLLPLGPQRWIAVDGEGGHVPLTTSDPREMEILKYAQCFHDFVSAEHLISGRGLPLLYQAVCAVDGLSPQARSAEEISRQALQNHNPACLATLHTFCALLGTVAAHLVLTLGARGGLYIGGGIITQWGDFIDGSQFRERFECKGNHSGYNAAIATLVIEAREPTLRGIAALLETLH